jgi:hypothetical protein
MPSQPTGQGEEKQIFAVGFDWSGSLPLQFFPRELRDYSWGAHLRPTAALNAAPQPNMGAIHRSGQGPETAKLTNGRHPVDCQGWGEDPAI